MVSPLLTFVISSSFAAIWLITLIDFLHRQKETELVFFESTIVPLHNLIQLFIIVMLAEKECKQCESKLFMMT